MKPKWNVILSGCALAGLFWAGIAPAQDYRATIQGVVTDPTQAVIAGAQVALLNEKTGIQAVKPSDTNGRYLFDFVEPGTYTLTVDATGFSRFTQKSILVQVRGDVTVNATLQVAGVAETINVSEAIVSLQFNTSNMELTVDRKMLTDLPILARNPFTLALLNPAVVNRYWADRNPFYMWSSSSIDVGGGTSGQNDLLLDGAPLMLSIKGSYAPPMDAVQEFSMQVNSVDAEFGHTAGGTMSVSMKSGTNEFHGTAYYFGRNPALNAASNSITHAPNITRNHIWGGTLGNPIRKNKLFTFTSWEQWRTKEPRTIQETLPTDLERTGDFSQSLNVDGALRAIYDPLTTQFDPASGTATRQPFGENRIPQSQMDPTALLFMKDIWSPNNPGLPPTGAQNFRETYTWLTDYWNISNRTDWNPTEKLRMFGRYSQFHNDISELHAIKSRAIPTDEGGAMYSFNVTGDAVYVLNPSTVFNVSGSYASIYDDYSAPKARVTEADLAGFWPNKWFAPYTKDLPAVYYPHLTVGDAYLGHRFFWFEHPDIYSLKGKVTHTRGPHNLKAGIEWRRTGGMINYPDPMSFNFTPALTADTFLAPDTSRSGDPWATFLLGAIGSDSRASYQSPWNLLTPYYAGYLQDDYKLSRKFTLNLGLRYEFEGGPVDIKDRISRYLDLNSPIPEMQSNPPQIPAEVTAIAQIPYKWNGAWVFTDSQHRAMYDASKKSFMPRAGIAVHLNDKTALRAGWARYVVPPVVTQAYMANVPMPGFTAETTVAPVIRGIPRAQLSDPFPATNPIILPVGKAYGRYTNLGGDARWDQQAFHTAVSERINVSLQRQLPYQLHLDVTYYMNLGYNLPYTKGLNLVDPNLSYTFKGALDQEIANPFYQYLTPEKMPGQLRNQQTVTVGSLLKPYPQYGMVNQELTDGIRDRYHALQIRVQRPFSKGLSFLAAYHYAREKSDNFFNDVDQYADRFTYIDSSNPRHRMTISGTYDFPVGRNRTFLSNLHPVANAILGGWSTSGIFAFSSGEFLRFPQAIVDGSPAISNPTRARYFDTSKFHVPLPYTPRANPWQYPGVTGPRFANVDIGLSKFFPIQERVRLEFKIEAYNLTNSFMAGPVNTDIYSPVFGASTSQANRGREMQYTLRVHF